MLVLHHALLRKHCLHAKIVSATWSMLRIQEPVPKWQTINEPAPIQHAELMNLPHSITANRIVVHHRGKSDERERQHEHYPSNYQPRVEAECVLCNKLGSTQVSPLVTVYCLPHLHAVIFSFFYS